MTGAGRRRQGALARPQADTAGWDESARKNSGHAALRLGQPHPHSQAGQPERDEPGAALLPAG